MRSKEKKEKKNKQKDRTEEGIKKETRDEIQELFGELFVDDLNRKIESVSHSTSGSANKLEELLKQTTGAVNVISDEVGRLRNDMKKRTTCLGDSEDWGDSSLVVVLNQMIEMLYACKQQEETLLTLMGVQSERVSIFESLESIEKHLEETKGVILSFEQHTVKAEFEKTLEKVAYIEKIVLGVQKDIDDIQRKVAEKDTVSGLEEKIDKVLSLGNVVENSCVGISGSLKHTSELQKEIIGLVERQEDLRGKEIQSISEEIKSAGVITEELFEKYMLNDKRKYTYMLGGMGALLLTNILTIILLFV